jgi:hypothetical protein
MMAFVLLNIQGWPQTGTILSVNVTTLSMDKEQMTARIELPATWHATAPDIATMREHLNDCAPKTKKVKET